MDLLNDDMTINELGDIVRCALSMIYSKLRSEHGYPCDTTCSVVSVGEHEYDVTLYFTDGSSFNSGEQHISTYWI